MYGPIAVTAALRGPLLDGGAPLHIDGLLALAWLRRHATHASASRAMPTAELAPLHLPLAQAEHLGHAVWMASAELREAPQSPAVVWQTGRRDPEDWDRLSGPVDVQSGPRKDVLLRRTGALTQRVRWVMWGSLREVRRALRLVWGREDAPHGQIGSARRSGSGEITAWSAQPGTHAPMDIILGPEGVRRHVPVTWLVSAERMAPGAHAPPYWHPGRQGMVAACGTSATLAPAAAEAIERACAR